MIEGFLLGVIVTATLATAAFFLKFWHRTRDPLFLGFGFAFLVEGCNRIAFLFVADPDGSNPVIYAVRLLSYLLFLGAIAYKNRGR